MSTFLIEFKKEKRTGTQFVLLVAGALGALYAFANYAIRKDTLLGLPLDPMDVLLTQLYGVIMILNMFGTIVAVCMIYNIEFRGNAIKKISVLPLSVPKMYFCKFLILMITLFIGILIQNLALAQLGIKNLPTGTFGLNALIYFALYSFVTSLPVLAFMLLIASRFENIWIPLGIGVGGFLSGLVLSTLNTKWLLLHPFVIMIKPAVTMSAQPDATVLFAAVLETAVLMIAGLWISKSLHYE